MHGLNITTRRFAACLGVTLIMALLAAPTPAAAGSSWTGAQAISKTGSPDPQRGAPQENSVAQNASGLAVAVWESYSYVGNGTSSIMAAVQSAGKWGAPVTISNTSEASFHPRVAVGGDGSAIAVWIAGTATSNIVEAAVLPAGSSAWSKPDVLASGTINGGPADSGRAQIAMDSQGNAVAVFPLWTGTQSLIQAVTRPVGGSWSLPAVTISDPSLGADHPTLAMNARGDAIAAWATGVYNTNTFIQVASRASGSSGWTGPTTISSQISIYAGYAQNPQVAIDGAGRGAAVWISLTSPGQLMGAHQLSLSPASWAPETGLTPLNVYYGLFSPSIGMDSAGNVTAAVTIFDSTIGVDKGTAWVVRGKPDGTWSPAQSLTAPPSDATTTRVAASPDGSLVLVGWIDFYYGQVQVSQLGTGGWGKPVMIGKATSIGEFSEYLSMSAGPNASARAVWKTSYGVQVMAATRR